MNRRAFAGLSLAALSGIFAPKFGHWFRRGSGLIVRDSGLIYLTVSYEGGAANVSWRQPGPSDPTILIQQQDGRGMTQQEIDRGVGADGRSGWITYAFSGVDPKNPISLPGMTVNHPGTYMLSVASP